MLTLSSLKPSRPAGRLAFTLLAAATLLAPLPLSAESKPAAGKKSHLDYFNQARAAYDARDYAQAEEKVLAALEINPQHPGSIALLHQLQARAPKADIIGTKYNAVKIPGLDFKDATVQSCFEYLKMQAATLSGGQTQVNFVYNLPKEILVDKRITLKMGGAPFLVLVDYVCQQAGVEKRLEKHAIVIAEPNRAEGPTEVEPKQVAAARASLRSLVLTSVEFKDAPVAEAFDTLRDLATKDSGGKEQPNIIVNLPADQMASLKVNMELKNIPFFEAVRLMAEHLDVNWKVGTYGITISPTVSAPPPPAEPTGSTEDSAPANGLSKGNSGGVLPTGPSF